MVASSLLLGRVCGYGFFVDYIVLYHLIEIVTDGGRRGFYLWRERLGGGEVDGEAGSPRWRPRTLAFPFLDVVIMDDRGDCVYAVT